jgi:hypothetical protein
MPPPKVYTGRRWIRNPTGTILKCKYSDTRHNVRWIDKFVVSGYNDRTLRKPDKSAELVCRPTCFNKHVRSVII